MLVPPRPLNETARLQALYQLALLDTAAEERFDRLTRITQQMFATPMALISLVDEQRQWFKSRQGLDACETSRDISFCGHAILGEEIFQIPDASLDSRFADNPLVIGAPNIRFYAGAPLSTPEGFHIGTLCIIDSVPRQLSTVQLQTLRDIADCVEAELVVAKERYLQALLLSTKAQHETVLHTLPDIVLMLDEQGRFLHSNDHPDLMIDKLRYLGCHISEILPSSLVTPCVTAMQQLAQGEDNIRFECHLELEHGHHDFEARIKSIIGNKVLLVLRNITQKKLAQSRLHRAQQLTNAITHAQASFISQSKRNLAFDGLLNDLLMLTESEYGFIGEVLHAPDGAPYVKTYVISDICWDQTSRIYYDKHVAQGLEFVNLQTLFGAVLSTGEVIIANDPANDARSGGLPKGHPRLKAFLGIPVHYADELVAMIAVANRPNGYELELVDFLQPLITVLGQLVNATQVRQRHERSQLELMRLSRIVSQTTNAVMVTDTHGQTVWINEGLTRMTGYTLAEMRGMKPGVMLQGAATDPAMIAQMSDSIKQQRAFEVDMVNYHKNQTPYWVHLCCNPLYDEQGRLEGFMSIASDITVQKEQEAQLRNKQHFLNAVLDNMPNMVFVKRASDLRFEYFNRAGEALLGVSRENLLGRNDYDLFPQEQADFFHKKDREVLQQKQVLDIPEETIETPHGTRILHTRKLALSDEQGQVQYLLGISEDITDRCQIERMKNEFVSTVSHELRTPLTAIAGALGLVTGGVTGALPEQAKKMLDIAFHNSQRLGYLINDLLDMEKLIAGKMLFDMQVQPLYPMVAQSIIDNQSYADQRQVKLQLTNHDATEILVRVDSQRLQQVLANLLSNAAKFSPQGSEVNIDIKVNNQHVRVTVQDHGPGIPVEFHKRIFQKFSQADASNVRKTGGTGLGLAISRELIERMGGTIGFDTELDVGTTFYFELPLLQR